MIYFILAIIILLLILLGATYYCYNRVFVFGKNENRDPTILLEGEQYEALKDRILPLVEDAIEIPYENLYTRSFDGYRLHAAYYEVDPAAPVEIMIHGYKSIAIRDFSGGLQYTLKKGHNVLLIDQRAHGKSEGRCLTFGILERRDCLSWANYIIKRNGPDTKIILLGISMGAATVLMTSELNMPENIIGIIADSAYTSPKEIICDVIDGMKLPHALVYPLVKLGARIFGRFDLEECSAEEAVKNCRVPVYFIHGEDDRYVPCEMGLRNYRACVSEKILLTVPDAGHGLGFLLDIKGYDEARTRFEEKVYENASKKEIKNPENTFIIS